jgi:esterase/lipase
MMRIAAMLDGHTSIPVNQPNVGFHAYPLRLYDFSDGLYAIDAAAPYSNVVGARLVKIGSADANEAYPRLALYAPRDNASTVKLLAPMFYVVPEILSAQHFISDTNQPQFVFEKPNGERVTVNPAPVAFTDYFAWLPGTGFVGLPKNDAPLYLSRRDEIFWSTYLTPTKTLYIQYNQVRTSANGTALSQFAADLETFVKENDAARVIVDVRHNPGGDNTTYFPLLNLLRDNEKINQRGKLFLITGRQTFSAAANFSTDVEQKTNALIAGEPMGGSPNLYGDTSQYTLPNSKINVYISRRTWIKSVKDDPRFSLEPQIPVELASQDYFAARDPVLDAILKYQPRTANEISLTTRTVTFTASYSATLNGTLYGNGATAVIFSNMGANKQSDWSQVAERVARRGYMTLTYDNRYWRANGTIDNSARVFVPDDLRAAMKFMREQGAQRVALVGASLGSMASLKVGAETNPAAVVIMSSPIDRQALPFLVTSDDVRAIASPKLFLVAENDALGFTGDVKKMYEVARAPKQLELFAGTAHGTDVFKTSDGDVVIETLLKFLETHVRLEP